jgi:hypothetical protein
MARSITIFDLNIVLQLLVFALFLTGIYYIKTKKNLRRHRLLLGMATGLNAISILFIMGRPFFAYFGLLTARFHEPSLLMIGIHAMSGGLAEVLGVTFLWKHSTNVRFKMRVATISWTIALFLGIAFYAYSYLR